MNLWTLWIQGISIPNLQTTMNVGQPLVHTHTSMIQHLQINTWKQISFEGICWAEKIWCSCTKFLRTKLFYQLIIHGWLNPFLNHLPNKAVIGRAFQKQLHSDSRDLKGVLDLQLFTRIMILLAVRPLITLYKLLERKMEKWWLYNNLIMLAEVLTRILTKMEQLGVQGCTTLWIQPGDQPKYNITATFWQWVAE